MFSIRRLSRPTCRALGACAVLLACHSMNFIAGATGYKRQTTLARHATATATRHLHDPSARDEFYGQPMNVAKYLVDLHDANAPFDFCGGMMFQLVLSNKLREHLALVAQGAGEQPMVFDSFKPRMFMTPGYSQDAHADNVKVFHGREIRQVPNAAGGMGFVLQLSMAEGDPEGWTAEEIKEYDGWGHDSGRNWRNADRWEKEDFHRVKAKFGERAFGLHHRFLGRLGPLGPLGRMFKMAGVLMGHEFCMASDPAKLLPGTAETAAREIGINMNQRQARCTPKFTKDGLPLTH